MAQHSPQSTQQTAAAVAGAPAPAAAVTEPAASQPGAGAAQGTVSPEDSGDEEEIVVTGQRPRGSVVGDIPPENTLDARDVRATGATNINELLEAIAPQLGSVQGRGGGQPVLLLNGQRISSFRELRDIPTEAIVRVEILPEEVALKYGYSADQKVVNIVLRQRFRSTTAQVGAGRATDGGYGNGNGDLTRFLVQRNGRTTLNLHAEGNSMLTEAERNIRLDQSNPTQSAATTEQELAARSLIGSKRDIRASGTFNRQISTKVSGTLNTEFEHLEGRSLIGLDQGLLDARARKIYNDTAHAGLVLNGQTQSQWRWTLTGNADLGDNLTVTDPNVTSSPRQRARATTESAELTAIANGNLFKLPAGFSTTTLTLEGNTNHLKSRSSQVGASSVSRTTGEVAVNLDLPISRRNRDFSALGNLTLNGNAEVNQLSDFGTLTKVGAGLNWSPVDRLNFIASWTREEGAPSINQLGDPVIHTTGSRIFDFSTGQTVFVDATTGGNPNLKADRRSVVKLSGNWQPFKNSDLRLRADYVHQTIARPISSITVTPQIEAAFPGHFIRNSSGQLVSVDLTPVNFDRSQRDQLRLGFDFSKPLKSRRPSQGVIDQMRAAFGFGPRGGPNAPGGGGQSRPSDAGGAPPGPPPGPAPGAEGPGGGGDRGGFGGGRGGGRGFFGGAGGSSRGRLQFSLTDTITFVDKVRITPGGSELDYLHGDASGSSGGTPRHNVQAQLGYFNNGIGGRIGANWRSGTTANSLNGDNLRFSPVGTFDLHLFANPGDIPEVAVKHPWLRGTQFRLELNNVFNSRPKVHDAAGNVPNNYQPDLIDPLGRTIKISFRKLFLPSPAWFRRQFQQERERNQQPSR